MLLLMGFAARSRMMTWICFGICIALFVFILILQFRDAIFHKKQKS